MARRLVILGTSGNAYDVLDVVDAINSRSPTWEVAGFLDDGRERGSRHLGFPVLGELADAAALGECWFINAIGSDSTFRRRPGVVARCGIGSERFATLAHPSATVSGRARLGAGVCVNHGASVAGGVAVGDHVSIGPLAVVGHDSVVGEHSILAPAALISGSVDVGRACYLGAACAVRQRIVIGEEALVGIGAVVIRNVPPHGVVVGNPARPLVTPHRV